MVRRKHSLHKIFRFFQKDYVGFDGFLDRLFLNKRRTKWTLDEHIPIDQRRLALGHFFLGLPISLAITEAVLDFAGKLIAFDIACFLSAVLAFENIFAFCHLENLLIF